MRDSGVGKNNRRPDHLKRSMALMAALSVGAVSLASAGAIVRPQSATAATIDGAITSFPATTAMGPNGSVTELKFTWAVPDHSQPGDTFTLVLPDGLESADIVPITLKEQVAGAPKGGGGRAIATGTWHDKTATFTLTDYVTDHPLNVHGDGYFSVRRVEEQPLDEKKQVTKSINGHVVPIGDSNPSSGPSQSEPSTPNKTRPAMKWGYWASPKKEGETDSKRAIEWSLALPVTDTEQPGPIVITDELPGGSGMAFDCASASYHYYQKNLGAGYDPAMPDGRVKVASCDKTKVTFEVPKSIDAYESITASINATITESQPRIDYENTFTYSTPGDQQEKKVKREIENTTGGTGVGTDVPEKETPVPPSHKDTPNPSTPEENPPSPAPTPTPSAAPQVPPTTTPQSVPANPDPQNILASTGAEIFGIVAIAALVSAVGFILIVRARRRRV